MIKMVIAVIIISLISTYNIQHFQQKVKR